MRIALIVGINYYEHGMALHGCVDDAKTVKKMLAQNHDGQDNFDCELMTASSSADGIRRSELKDKITALFAEESDIALFYFAGHGHVEPTGGYLLTSDASRGDEGVSLSEVLTIANRSPASNKILILDSCHSGIAGNPPNLGELTSLAEGVTILTASTKDQYATEANGQGVFSALLVDALSGAASSLTGDITPGSIYAHIDQSLGEWEQRPVFKTNVKQFVSLRRSKPAITLEELRQLTEFFPSEGYSFALDPSFEPETKGREEGMPAPVEDNTRIFGILQKFNRLNLLNPENAPHMWHAAMQSRSCRLTLLGEHYRRLVAKNKI